jgi:phosphatidylserine decarboxylase
MSVGHSPDIPQYEPDMPKKAENITAEEMQEAKRRIEGSLAPPSNPSTLLKSIQ